MEGKNSAADWIDFCVRDSQTAAVTDEAKKVMTKIDKYSVPTEDTKNLNGVEAIMHVSSKPSKTQTVTINGQSPKLCPKLNFVPSFLGIQYKASPDPFVTAYIHESRHSWILYEDNLAGNDANGDLEPREMYEKVSAPCVFEPGSTGRITAQRTIVDLDDKHVDPDNGNDALSTVNPADGPGLHELTIQLFTVDGYAAADLANTQLILEYSFPSPKSNITILELDAYTWTDQNQSKP